MYYADFIQKILLQTAEIARENFGKVTGFTKKEDNNQVLTETDLTIGKYIITAIEKNFPDHNIIDEEAGVVDKKSQFTWVVDPIDGTSNFANGVLTYGTYIGLLQNQKPIAGGIGIPELREVYYAELDKGTFCNEKQIHMSPIKNLNKVLVAYGIDAHPDEVDFVKTEGNLLMNIVLNIQNLRISNSAYDGAMVAKGSYGAWLCRSSKIWDNVGLQIVIEEAGGLYTDFFGKPIDYSNPLQRSEENFTYCTAFPVLHKQLQEIIHASS